MLARTCIHPHSHVGPLVPARLLPGSAGTVTLSDRKSNTELRYVSCMILKDTSCVVSASSRWRAEETTVIADVATNISRAESAPYPRANGIMINTPIFTAILSKIVIKLAHQSL